MRAMTSSSSSGSTSRAPRFSRHLLGAARAGDHGRHVRVLRAPRDGELRERAVELVGDRLQLAHLVVRRRVGEHARAATRSPGSAARLPSGTPSRYLPVSRPGRERAPRGEAEPDVLVEAGVLALDPPAVEQVVLRLLHHRLVQVVPLGDLPRGADLVGGPLRRAPVVRLARSTRCRTSPTPSPRSACSGRRGGRRGGRRSRGRAARASRRSPAAGTCG